MKRQTPHPTRFAPALTTVGLFLLAGLALGGSSIAAPTPLHTFHPGSAGEPAWTMLTLAVDRPDAELKILFKFDRWSCPSAWGVALFRGQADEATSFGDITFDTPRGKSGVVISVGQDPPGFERSTVENDGAKQCPAIPTFAYSRTLPLGEVHLLHYAAGLPFEGSAAVTAPSGGIRVVGLTSGETSYYVDAESFSRGRASAALHSPGTHYSPNLGSRGGIWDEEWYLPGDTLAAAEANVERSASLDFEGHAFYKWVGSRQNVMNASVTDPTGNVRYASENGAASANGMTLNGRGFVSTGPSASYPPGTYTFEMDMNIAASGAPGAPWHLFAVDYQFPRT